MRPSRFHTLLMTLMVLAACSSGSPQIEESAPLGTFIALVGEVQDSPRPDPSFCRGAFTQVWDAGLKLPVGYQALCPAQAKDWNGKPHWGITSFGPGPEANTPYVAINLDRIRNRPRLLYYVVAHEVAHTRFGADECAADRAAQAAGATLAYSPYRCGP